MSAFLGPIHYWLYNKIQLQEELIKDIVAYGEKEQWKAFADGNLAEKRRLHNGLYQLDLMQQRSITQLITVVKDGTV